MNRYVSLFLGLLFVVAAAGPLQGAQTNMWFLDDLETLLPGTFEGTGITSEGTISPTTLTDSVDLEARMVWDVERDGSAYLVATSLPSALIRVGEDGSTATVTEVEGLGFTAMTGTEDYVYAAASPSGEIHRYNRSDGSIEVVATVDEMFVWDLSSTSEGTVYLGTGTRGNLYRLSGTQLERIGSVPGANIMSLVHHGGNLHLGDDRGGLYRLNGGGLESLYGFRNAEVNALYSDNGSLYVGVNKRQPPSREMQQRQEQARITRQLEQHSMRAQSQAPSGPQTGPRRPGELPEGVDPEQLPDEVRQQLEAEREAAQQQEAQPEGAQPSPEQEQPEAQPPADMSEDQPRVLPEEDTTETPPRVTEIPQQVQEQPSQLFSGLIGHAVYRFRSPDQLTILHADAQQVVHDLGRAGDKLLVATGPQGRIFEMDDSGQAALHTQVEQEHVLGLETESGRLRSFSTGSAGRLNRTVPFEQGAATYRSPVLDAAFLSSWGELTVRRTGSLQLRTRSGNTQKPDDMWSDWGEWRSGETFDVETPSGRFFQVEVRFLGEDAVLKRTEIPYQITNQAPRILEVQVQPQPIHQLLRREFQHPMEATGRPAREQGSSAEVELPLTRRAFQWNAMDPDGDPTLARLSYRPVEGSDWIPMHERRYLERPAFQWDVSDLADGYYEVRLQVTDGPYNAREESQTVERILGPFLVDQTSPEVRNLRQRGDEIRLEARDDHSRIVQAQYRVNDDTWQTVRPEDGVFDSRSEQFRWQLDRRIEDDDYLQIRVMDEAGNTASGRLMLER